jgi:hypothetical protein
MRRKLGILTLTIGLASNPLAVDSHAASLQGSVTDQAGAPLAKVPVCLREASESRGCSRVQTTDRKGNYRFNGLKPGPTYRVSVFQDDSASGRKFDRYRTYVWDPLQQTTTLTQKNESQALARFTGKFNFSNFQRGLTLAGIDFPELSSIDLAVEPVFLKVFVPPVETNEAPSTIYLGQVSNAETLAIVASVPLATPRIDYQIFSTTLSLAGSIFLSSD